MKWIYRLFTLAIIAGALIVPFFIDNQQGEPMLSLSESKDLLPTFSPSAQSAQIEAHSQPANKIYKWQDTEGQWHYGDTPPGQNATVVEVQINTNTNIIQPLDLPEAQDAGQPESFSAQMSPSDGDILSFERAKNVMRDAKLAAKAMEARNEQLRALSDNNASSN